MEMANWDYELYRTYFDCLENLFLVWFKGPAWCLRLLSGQWVLMLYLLLGEPQCFQGSGLPRPCESPGWRGKTKHTAEEGQG